MERKFSRYVVAEAWGPELGLLGGMGETGEFWGVANQPVQLNGNLQAQWDTLSHEIRWRATEEDIEYQSTAFHTCIYIRIYPTHSHKHTQWEWTHVYKVGEHCEKMCNNVLMALMVMCALWEILTRQTCHPKPLPSFLVTLTVSYPSASPFTSYQ